MNSIDNFLKRADDKIGVCVVGDIMIDEYYNVKVTRISPEFPTQIMLSKNVNPDHVVPGGAANVCLQMSKWQNVFCNLIGFYDDACCCSFVDRKFCTDFGLHIAHPEYNVRCPLKRRFYDVDYPLPRWDVEEEDYGMPHDLLLQSQQKLLERFKGFLRVYPPDIVILSDYGKGLFTNGFAEQVIQLCNEANIPTIVDPKDPPVDRWRDCTYFKPNAYEAIEMTGIAKRNNWWAHFDHLQQKYGIDNVIITDGPNPPFIPHVGDPNDFKLARQPQKESVIGAGDCFCAFLAMSLAHKMNLQEAVEVAWNASSAYIERKHNTPLMPHEFARWNDPILSKIVSVDEMYKIVQYDPCKWVWTNGCFDILHVGHLKTLEIAKQLGNKVIVGLNTDSSVRSLKGETRPVVPFEQRAEHLAHLQYVDFVVPIEEDTPLSIIERLCPSKLVKGGDYKVEDVAGWNVVGKENVHLVPLIAGLSTSKIIEKMGKR